MQPDSNQPASSTHADVQIAKVAVHIAEIRLLRTRFENRVAKATQILNAANTALAELQTRCPHVAKHSQPEYDFTDHWCDDCGKHW